MGRFFNLDSPVMVALTKMADLIIVNLLAFFCCLPIITVGASMTALHYVVLKIVRDEECYIVKSFFKSFKENFKQATVIWLIEVLLIIIFAADFWIIRNAQNSLPSWMSLLLIGVAILAVLALTLAFPLLAKFDNSVKMTLKNSALMGIMILPKTILMAACWALPLIIIFWVPQIMPVTFCFGMSGPALLNAFLYNKTFKKFEPEQDVKDADDWSIPVEEDAEALEETDETDMQEKDVTAGEGSAEGIEETKKTSEE